MRATATSASPAGMALILASVWMMWVISQGTGQVVESGLPGLRYASTLSIAILFALAALVAVRLMPLPNRRVGLMIGLGASLEILIFGVVWFGLVVMPLGDPV